MHGKKEDSSMELSPTVGLACCHCPEQNVFWRGAIHVRVGLLLSGFPGRKTDATIGFGLGSI
jgi:hypothetical protein